MSQAARDQLRQRFLDRYSDLVPPAPRGQFDESRRPRRPYVRADEKAIGYVPYAKGELPNPLPATLVAFYLPQFHTIPENDEWWGKGFTEWRNVTRALPQFEGHVQPRLPGDLGFYNLRDPEVMRQQARLAKEYGVGAFCFYFYWFSGKTLLEAPLENWLEDTSIELPFCLCWANEKWSRRWDGRGDDILIDQQHSPIDDLSFIHYVSKYLRDPRYLRVDGKPLLLIYRPNLFPDIKATAERWRHWCRTQGLGEIHLAYVQSFEKPDPSLIGFDSAVEFPPNLSNTQSAVTSLKLINPDFRGQVLDWRDLARQLSTKSLPSYRLFPGVNAAWDNEPRRSGFGLIYRYASPRMYRDWLRSTVKSRLVQTPECDKLIFLNAWNEWAEGAVLEPDARLGYAWLDATRSALDINSKTAIREPLPCVVIHAWHVEILEELLSELDEAQFEYRLIVTTGYEKKTEIARCLERQAKAAELFAFENRGRDVLPFLIVADQLERDGVELILKIHTKQSIHRNDGDSWRRELTKQLFGDGRAAQIIACFKQQPILGLVAAEDHIQPLNYFWGANQKSVEYLCARLGFETPASEEKFAAGTMFWVRTASLRPLLDAHLSPSEFESEQGQVDGTLAHALERIFMISVDAAGYSVMDAAQACGLGGSPIPPYTYASRA